MNLFEVPDFPIGQKVREETKNDEYKHNRKVNKTNFFSLSENY
jgi:hypothetical protein